MSSMTFEIRQRVNELVQNARKSFANRVIIDRGKVEVDGHLRRVTSQDDAKKALGSVLFRHERTKKKQNTYLRSREGALGARLKARWGGVWRRVGGANEGAFEGAFGAHLRAHLRRVGDALRVRLRTRW